MSGHPRDLLHLFGRRGTPVLLQAEAAECGLACLAMVASHHGHETDLMSLRRRFSVSLKGTTLRALIEVADQLGLAGRAMRGELSELNELKLRRSFIGISIILSCLYPSKRP